MSTHECGFYFIFLVLLLGTDWDDRTQTLGVFYIHGPLRTGWASNVSKELGNYDYLLGNNVMIPAQSLGLD